MKTLVAFYLTVVLAISSVATFAQGTTRVRGYTKRNGTRVESHRRTKSNSTERDNWSSRPSTNPDTGKRGTKSPRR